MRSNLIFIKKNYDDAQEMQAMLLMELKVSHPYVVSCVSEHAQN